jgi:hypothetical protein
MGADEARRVYNVTQQLWYLYIQDAIDDTNAGDEMVVYPDTYYENIDFKGKAITVRSADPNDPDVVAATIIDANGSGIVVTFESSEDADSVLRGFVLTGGDAGYPGGGGIYCSEASPTIGNCVISSNAAFRGGGMLNISASPTVTNCVFTSNAAEWVGGGMDNYDSSPTLANCLFYGNTTDAWGEGGGMDNDESSPTVVNSTFYGNSAYYGGGISNYDASSTPKFINCIVWGNSAEYDGDEVYNYYSPYTADPNFSFCDANGCGGSGNWDPDFGTNGGNNIDENPNFEDDTNDDYHLKWGSPCINTGNPDANYASQVDIDGESRVSGGRVDIGADEVAHRVHNLDSDEWYITVQAAIDDANNADVIEVLEATYYEAIDYHGNSLTVRSNDPNDPNVVAATVINANGANYTVTFKTSEDGNSVLKGFTITGAARSGIYCYGHVSPTISDCNITGNGNASYDGGGMYIDYYCSPAVKDCVFHNNTGDYGGGMYIEDSTPDVVNCVFVDSLADYGGGMAIYDCSPRVINCLFYQNEADYDGGGLYIENEDALPEIINCTFFGNHAEDDGGGMFCYDLATVYITNCIFWGDTAGDSGGEIYNNDCDVYVENCDIEGDINGDKCGGDSLDDEGGNIDDDPEFEDDTDPDGDDDVWATCDDGLRIESTSPCKDEGDNDAVEGIDTDIKGSDRIINGDVDMGAYEYDSGC